MNTKLYRIMIGCVMLMSCLFSLYIKCADTSKLDEEIQHKVTFAFPKNNISIRLHGANNKFLVNELFETNTIDKQYCYKTYQDILATNLLIQKNNTIRNTQNTNFSLQCFVDTMDNTNYYVLICGKNEEELNYSGLYYLINQNRQMLCCASDEESTNILAMNHPNICSINFKTFDNLQAYLRSNKLIPCTIADVFGSVDNVEIIDNSVTTSIADATSSSVASAMNGGCALQNHNTNLGNYTKQQLEQDTSSDKSNKSKSGLLVNNDSSQEEQNGDTNKHYLTTQDLVHNKNK